MLARNRKASKSIFGLIGTALAATMFATGLPRLVIVTVCPASTISTMALNRAFAFATSNVFRIAQNDYPRSNASTTNPATLQPACSKISTMQVGEVTFTSVK